MAIINAVPGLAVHVTVNDEPLKEIVDPGARSVDPYSTTRYLEVNQPSCFAFKVRVAPGFRPGNDGLWVSFTFDGGDIFGFHVAATLYRNGEYTRYVTQVYRTINGLKRLFDPTFSRIETSE